MRSDFRAPPSFEGALVRNATVHDLPAINSSSLRLPFSCLQNEYALFILLNGPCMVVSLPSSNLRMKKRPSSQIIMSNRTPIFSFDRTCNLRFQPHVAGRRSSYVHRLVLMPTGKYAVANQECII